MQNIEVKIRIRGHHPRTYSNNEHTWREEIAKQAKQKCCDWKDFALNGISEVGIEMNFFIKNPTKVKPDIDNLAKPVIDTLFSAFPQGRNSQHHPTAALCKENDGIISKIIVSRHCVESENDEGVDICIWKQPDQLRKG